MSIGDINSQDIGSGARFNSGKADWSLLPLTIVAASLASKVPPDSLDLQALRLLGSYQATGSIADLFAILDLYGLEGLEECARVFEYGKKKYAAWNWAKGMAWSVCLACAARHLRDILLKGQTHDEESGHLHRGHVLCNVFMLLHYQVHYRQGNDLPNPAFFEVEKAAA